MVSIRGMMGIVLRVEIVVSAGPMAGRQFAFDRADTFICGRSADAHMSLGDDAAVSRQHFVLEIVPPHVRLTDLGSRNGTYVNGLRYGGTDAPRAGERLAADGAKSVLLRHGDEIAVGASRLRVHVRIQDQAAAPEAPLAAGGPPHCPLCSAEVSRDPNADGPDQGHLCPACVEQMQRNPFDKARRMVLGILERLTGRDYPDLPGFDITGELGRGGMARVYRAVNRRTGGAVALKVILPEMASHPEGYRLFKREVEVNRQLKHKNIVELIYPVIGQGACLFIMELVDGTDLHSLMNAQGGKIAPRMAAPIFLDVLDGLAYAHRARIAVGLPNGTRHQVEGIVHRDIKPTNILVYRADGGWHAKVADFGLAKAFSTAGFSDMTSPGAAHGTPAYWPREQLLYYRFLHPPSDVFSAAAVFYQALTGMYPRNGITQLVEVCQRQGRQPTIPDFVKLITEQAVIPLRFRDPTLPPHVSMVIDRALAEQPLGGGEDTIRDTLGKMRYPDAAAFREALATAFRDDGLI